MPYLFAYDIADPRRLKRVARRFECRAVRCQKSVFLFDGGLAQARRLLDEIATLLDAREDCVQMWKLPPTQPWLGEVRGTSPLISLAVAVLDSESRHSVMEPNT